MIGVAANGIGLTDIVESIEQAEVGQSPTLLAVCAANEVLGILRGYPYGLTASRKSFLVYPAVYRKDFYRYINKP